MSEPQFKFNIGDKVVYYMDDIPIHLTIRKRWEYRKKLLYGVNEASNHFLEHQLQLSL